MACSGGKPPLASGIDRARQHLRAGFEHLTLLLARLRVRRVGSVAILVVGERLVIVALRGGFGIEHVGQTRRRRLLRGRAATSRQGTRDDDERHYLGECRFVLQQRGAVTVGLVGSAAGRATARCGGSDPAAVGRFGGRPSPAERAEQSALFDRLADDFEPSYPPGKSSFGWNSHARTHSKGGVSGAVALDRSQLSNLRDFPTIHR